MRSAIAVTTTASQVVEWDDSRNWDITQNNSDTDWALDFTGAPGLTVENGVILKAGETLVRTGPFAKLGIVAIHGGSGSKAGRVQGGRVPE